MDIHARAQQHLSALDYHFPAQQGIQRLHRLRVKGAGQAGAAGQQGGGFADSDAGRAVGGDHGGDAPLL